MRTRATDERGWVVVVAIVVMTLMLAGGLLALALADTQQQASRKQREREAALNLAEGVLYTQSFILASPATTATYSPGWPGAVGRAYPACTLASGGTVSTVLPNGSAGTSAVAAAQCPSDAFLTNLANAGNQPATFRTVDTGPNTTWNTKVQDNGSPTTPSGDYANASTTSWDANGDHKVWVRAAATVRGHTRTVIGLMQIDLTQVDFPPSAIIAGSAATGPAGNHAYIDVGTSNVEVRCSNASSTTCADYQLGSNNKVSTISGAPSTISTGYPGGPVLPDPSALLQRALADGTYYPNCPPLDNQNKATLSGAVVWVNNCTVNYGNGSLNTTNCTISGIGGNQNCINAVGSSPPTYGILVWARGTLSIGANANYFGVIYHLNEDNCGPGVTAPGCPAAAADGQEYMVTIQGSAHVWGAIDVDGNGGVLAGSTSGAFTYDANAFNPIQGYGTAGLVQNSWRELSPGQ